MKRIAKVMVFLMLFNCFGFTYTSLALAAIEETSPTKVSIDLKDLDDGTRNRVIDMMKEAEKKKNTVVAQLPQIDNVKKFTDYGTAIATTIQAVCKVLNVEVNAFVKTPVGNLVMWMVIYHVIGKDLLKVGFAFMIWFMIAGILAFTFSRFHLPYKKVTKNHETKEETVEYIQKYNFRTAEAKVTSVWVHGGLFSLITLILILKVI